MSSLSPAANASPGRSNQSAPHVATDSPPAERFSLSEARSIVGQFFTPNPWIYWTDFLLSFAVGVACFQLVALSALGWPMRAALFVVSALLYYRCALFIHELVHIRAGTFMGFRFVWNLLCGIPFLIPTFVYYTHLDHHRRKHYGTKQDGEYIPLATLPRSQLWLYLAQIPVLPVLAIVRWGVLTPLTWFNTTLRDLVHRRASSMIMDPMYIRPLPGRRTLRVIRLQEVACFLWLVLVVVLLLRGTIKPQVVVQAYLTGVFVIGINALRTLGAHRWTNPGGEMDFVEQMLDSVNYSRRPWLTGLWAPVGLRFHALHHIFPTIPYHSMAKAHERLMHELPSDSPYRQTEGESLLSALWLLWERTGRAERAQVPARPTA